MQWKVDEIEVRRSERSKDRPKTSYRLLNNCLTNAHAFCDDISNNYNDIKNRTDRTKWEEAVKEELDSHFYNKTWTSVDQPLHKNIVDCKWVFSIKTNEHGKQIKYKARLVARGFTQKYLSDYDETFAPVARISSFWFILSMANQFN